MISEGEDGQVEEGLLSGMLIMTSFSFLMDSRCAYGTTCRINSRFRTITRRMWATWCSGMQQTVGDALLLQWCHVVGLVLQLSLCKLP